MPLTLRKLIFIALMLTALLHEPTFRLLVNILVNAHIFARIAADVQRNSINAHFSAVTAWVITTFYEALASLATRIERLIWALEPLTRLVQAKIVYWATIWLRQSPRWLCDVNEWTVGAGEGMAWKMGGEEGGEVLEGWLVAADEVARFCASVRGKASLERG